MLLLVGEFYALNNSETLTPPKEGCLMVFTKKNYKGQSKEICGDMAKIGKDFIKSIKSVRLGKGVFMTAFKKYKFSGKNISVNRNVRNLGKEKMSRVKSLLITNPNCLTFYSKCKFKGKKFEVCKDTAQLPANLDNKASSVVAGKNTWKLFKDGDFKGESFNSIQYSYDKCLKKSKLGNKAMSSAKIFEIPLPANCVRLFQGENYTGTYTDYCETEKWVGSQNNDKFSSIKIGKSAFAMLFKHKKLKGKHYLVTENIPALKEKKFDDMLSSLVVFQRHCSVLFTKCNFQGSYSIVCGAMEQFPKKFDNKYQSYINGDKEYDLFADKEFKGKKLVLKSKSYDECIRKVKFAKKASSTAIHTGELDDECIRFYTDANDEKSYRDYCGDVPKLFKKYKNKFSRIVLGKSVCAVIFDKPKFKGDRLIVEKDIKNLKEKKFDNKIESILIYKRNCVNLYKHCDFYGGKVEICESTPFLEKLNNQVSSYVVGSSDWIMHDKKKYKGKQHTIKAYTADNCLVDNGFNDLVTSLSKAKAGTTATNKATKGRKGKGIKKGCVRLYQHINFKGASKLFCKDFAKFAKNGKENDQYSSARLGRGVSAVIFQHYDYKGKSLYIHKNIKDFRKRKFNDIASSIILVGRGCIKLFQHYGFGGKATQFCKKSKFVGKKINDQFSSYIVGNHRWVLFEHGNFKGAKLVAKRRSVVRKIAKGWNDKVSSLRRHGKGKGIKKGCVRLYQHINFKGASKLFCKDFAKFAKNGKENDQYSSARLGRGVSAVIFQHYDYKGKSLYIHKNIKDFRKRKFNDIASSIRILNKKCLYLFSKSDFNESARQFCKSNSSLQKDGLLKFGSFIRGSRKWIVYDQTFFKGFSANISGKKSIANIAPDFFTGYVASVKIYESGLKSHCIRLYEKIDFGGNFKDYCKRKNKVSKKYDNKFSSAKIGSKVYAVLFDDSKYKGSNLKVHGDISDFSKYSFKDTVSSLIIHKRECLLLFKGCGFKGKSRHLCRNFKKLPRKQNNSYSSYINGEISFDVFAKPGFTGRKMTIDPTKIDSCLKDDEFNNVISSFKLTSNKPNDNCAIFFRNKDYTGWNIEYCDDKKIISRIQNNNFSSVRVGKNVEVLLFEGKSFAKKSLRVKESTHDLSVYKWNNKTSSIIIAKKGCISLYQHKNFKGKKSEICKDTPALGAADDSFSSYVNTDFAWNLYVHKNYEGRSIHVAAHEEAKSLTALRFNEITSSIKRGQPELSLGCVRLFKDENYNGDYKDVCKHDKDLLSNDLNGVKSVQLSENAFAVLFSETKFMGKIEYILESSQNIEKIDAKSIIVIKSNCMTYFNNCDFGGRREEICGQDKNLTSSQTGMASYLNGKVDFEIFGENDFFGRPKVIEQITWKRCTINQGIPDLMSSIKPHEDSNNLADGCIRLYEHEDHKGKHKTYCDDHPYVFDDYNNIFSSIEIGKNVYVMLFEEKNYLGKELYVFDSHKSFKSFKFDDLTTSLIIVKRNCITFFTDCDFKKDKTTVCGNVADFGNLDEKISSYINGDTPYWLYQNKNYDGNKISADVRGYEKCMSIFAWDDEVSSVAIK